MNSKLYHAQQNTYANEEKKIWMERGRVETRSIPEEVEAMKRRREDNGSNSKMEEIMGGRADKLIVKKEI